jgi:2-C-methyl-D-erythritol 2,4-cyclodiphosphate synthase
MSIRVGIGYDSHRFAAGKPLRLGGVTVPHTHGLVGHSDGDVALHAVADALIGAAGLGDIGRHFPDSDARFKSIDSRILLRHVQATLAERGWKVGNVDATVVAQQPKLAPHLGQMIANLAADLDVTPDHINVKATTTEKLGFAGREEGIAAHAVVLLERVVESLAG